MLRLLGPIVGAVLASTGCIKGECIVHGSSRSGGACIESSNAGPSEPQMSRQQRSDLRARIARLEPPCAAGDRLACTNLVEDLRLLDAQDSEQAAAAELACRANVPRTCAFAADAVQALEPIRARELYEIGCQLGEDAACRGATRTGSVRVFDHRQARCAAGDLGGCDALGELLADPTTQRYDPERARPLLMDACRRAVSACQALGELEVRP